MKNEFDFSHCACGKEHISQVDTVLLGSGVLYRLPELIERYHGTKPFLLADRNTHLAAGKKAEEILERQGIEFSSYIFSWERVEPDERAVGAAVMHFDHTCDLILGIGSGVIHDIGKILSKITNRKYVVIATAPSMDGYASGTSSMSMDGVKVSLSSRCADGILGDIDVLKNAPVEMLISGLGDMLAKQISIAEWRISHLINGEYYCQAIAELIRGAVKECVDHAEGLLRREEAAVGAVFQGLITAGQAMAYAGVSRPASGVEHYFSHIWDMRGLEFGLAVSSHGMQCAVGTLYAAKIYHRIKHILPDREKALAFVKGFDVTQYHEGLRVFLGKSAHAMIALEKVEKKYDKKEHRHRLDRILSRWDEIVKIIEEEIPSPEKIEALMDAAHCPKTAEEIGIDPKILLPTFYATRDIRDKYVLSRLCWDLGLSDDVFQGILF